MGVSCVIPIDESDRQTDEHASPPVRKRMQARAQAEKPIHILGTTTDGLTNGAWRPWRPWLWCAGCNAMRCDANVVDVRHMALAEQAHRTSSQNKHTAQRMQRACEGAYSDLVPYHRHHHLSVPFLASIYLPSLCIPHPYLSSSPHLPPSLATATKLTKDPR